MKHCNACDEDYQTLDRICPICGEAFTTPPASTAASAAATSLLPLLPHEIIRGQQQPAEQQQERTPEEQMQHIAQRLRELLIQGGFLGGAPGDDEDLEAWLMNNGGADGEGGGAAPGRRKNGLKDEEIARLPVSQLHATSTMLLSVTLKVVGGGEKELLTVEAIPADFSPVPPDGGKFALVAADPLTAHELPLRNQAACSGKVLVTKRGKKTFAAMAKEAGRIGARGCVVLNSLPIWPYMMKDSKGEAKEVQEKYGDVFIVMISQKDGEELLERIEGQEEGGGAKNEEDNHNQKNDELVAHLAVSSVEKDCVICVCAFVEGEEILRLPCSHVYHADCCRKWLGLQKTCPYCRSSVKAPRG